MDFLLLGLRLLFFAGLYGFIWAVARIVWPRAQDTKSAFFSVSLIFCGGPGAVNVNGLPWAPGQKFTLSPPVTFGRQVGNTVRIEDPFVSTCHAELVADATGLWLIDRGSKNGTWVGARRIVRPVKLRPGEEFRLGETRFRLEG